MTYWYEKTSDGRWIFCYSPTQEEQKIIDEVMPQAIDALREIKYETALVCKVLSRGTTYNLQTVRTYLWLLQ